MIARHAFPRVAAILVAASAAVSCLSLASDEGDKNGSGGSGGDASSALDSGADYWGLEPLDCDTAFSLSENPVIANQTFTVHFTDPSALTSIDLQVSGPGNPTAGNWQAPKPSCSPCTWSWDVTGHAAGELTLTVTATELKSAKTCKVWSVVPG